MTNINDWAIIFSFLTLFGMFCYKLYNIMDFRGQKTILEAQDDIRLALTTMVASWFVYGLLFGATLWNVSDTEQYYIMFSNIARIFIILISLFTFGEILKSYRYLNTKKTGGRLQRPA